MMVSQNFQLEISYCNSTERKEKNLTDCFEKTVIDKYVKDIQIDLWTVQHNIDYDRYNTEPVFISQKVLKSTLLDQ